jgi:5-methylcytosine-specific restriction endonuclease McrA
MNTCLFCNKILTKSQTKFCCQDHCNQYKKEENIKKWLNGEDEGWSGTGIKKFIRTYLLEKNNYKCEKCGWGEKNPFSGLIPLEIHHLDGNYKNNKIENLQVLCPNCHSLTDTYKSMNQDSTRDRGEYINRKAEKNYCIDCGKEISSTSTRCKECDLKNRAIPLEEMPITREELKEKIRTIPFTTIASEYNVTDNAIRKWCDKFNLPRKKSEIKRYSDEEWNNI